MNHPHYKIDEMTETHVLLRDLGPWHQYLTITNDAEHVVAEVLPLLGKRKLLVIDSLGDTDELLVVDGKFAGFAAGER